MVKYSLSEYELRKKYMNQVNLKTVLLYPEVPVFCRSVDLVEKNKEENSITAIEFKLHDWKKAISQAKSVSVCFDYIYICIPRPKKKNNEMKIYYKCKEQGIGLLLYDECLDNFERVLEGKKAINIWNKQKEMISDNLEALEWMDV